jgi:hypothetical protein
MKKQLITVFVAALALTVFSCRESKEEKTEESIENIKADVQEDMDDEFELESDSLQIELQEEETVISEE